MSAVTFGLPSRSPPIQVPSVSGTASAGSSTPCSASCSAISSVSCRKRLLGDVAQVVQRVAGLVDRGRADLAKLVRLPHQIDQLGQLPVLPGPGGGCPAASASARISEIRRSLVSTDRRLASVGMCGEHRPDVQCLDRRLELGGAQDVGDLCDGPGQPAGFDGSARAKPGPGAPVRRRWPGGNRKRRPGPARSPRRSEGPARILRTSAVASTRTSASAASWVCFVSARTVSTRSSRSAAVLADQRVAEQCADPANVGSKVRRGVRRRPRGRLGCRRRQEGWCVGSRHCSIVPDADDAQMTGPRSPIRGWSAVLRGKGQPFEADSLRRTTGGAAGHPT